MPNPFVNKGSGYIVNTGASGKCGYCVYTNLGQNPMRQFRDIAMTANGEILVYFDKLFSIKESFIQ